MPQLKINKYFQKMIMDIFHASIFHATLTPFFLSLPFFFLSFYGYVVYHRLVWYNLFTSPLYLISIWVAYNFIILKKHGQKIFEEIR